MSMSVMFVYIGSESFRSQKPDYYALSFDIAGANENIHLHSDL